MNYTDLRTRIIAILNSHTGFGGAVSRVHYADIADQIIDEVKEEMSK